MATHSVFVAPPSGRRRRAAIPLLIALALATAGGCSQPAPAPPPPPPTVVVFVLDTVRQDALGSYGHPLDPTPRIDSLADDGVRFDQAISTSGWTLPAVGSLLTGTWPTIHGGIGRSVMLRPLRPELTTAPEVLQAHGFRTVGIASAAFVSPMVGIDRGFDHFDHRYSFNHDARDAREVVDVAIEQLRQRRDEPLFLFIHLFDPHLYYAPPEGYATKYTGGRSDPPPPLTLKTCRDLQTGEDGQRPPPADDVAYVRGVYLGEINYMDGEVGRFIDELKSLGLYDRSTVVVTSDHGEEFWDHGEFEHGHTLYDELIRVPLIVKLPGDVAVERRVVSDPVRMLDIMPTVFDLFDIAPPGSFDGASMMPLVHGQPDGPRTAFAESTLYGPQMVAWRTERYKYIHDESSGLEGLGELYDWRNDPLERRNLTVERPELAVKMRAELFEFYRGLLDRSKTLSDPELVELGPTRIEQLRSLGYVR